MLMNVCNLPVVCVADDEPEAWLRNDHWALICGLSWGCRMSGGLRKPAPGPQKWCCLPIIVGRRKSGGSKIRANVQFANLSVWYLDDEQLAKVSAFADRTMTLQATIQDGVIWLSDDKNNLEVNLTARQQPS